MDRAYAIDRLKDVEPALRAMGAETLYLFGSVARDQQNANSDVDLFVDLKPGHPFTLLDLAAAQRLLSEWLAAPADLITRDSLHPVLADRILSEAIRIF